MGKVLPKVTQALCLTLLGVGTSFRYSLQTWSRLAKAVSNKSDQFLIRKMLRKGWKPSPIKHLCKYMSEVNNRHK